MNTERKLKVGFIKRTHVVLLLGIAILASVALYQSVSIVMASDFNEWQCGNMRSECYNNSTSSANAHSRGCVAKGYNYRYKANNYNYASTLASNEGYCADFDEVAVGFAQAFNCVDGPWHTHLHLKTEVLEVDDDGFINVRWTGAVNPVAHELCSFHFMPGFTSWEQGEHSFSLKVFH